MGRLEPLSHDPVRRISPAAVSSASCCRAALSSACSCATDPSVSSLTTARLRTSLARAANLSVLSVSAKQSSVGERVAMSAVLLFPPRVSRRSLRGVRGDGEASRGGGGVSLRDTSRAHHVSRESR